MKKFKNNKQSADTWTGMTIQPGSYYEPLSDEIARWQNDSKVLSDIGSGNLIINNGTNDITDVAQAINFLKDTIPEPLDTDNAPLSRGKVAPLGWTYQMHGIELCTSTLGSIYSKNYLGNDFSFTTLKFYELANEVESQITGDNLNQSYLDSNCIKTVIDWEPTFDYEIIGGHLLHYDTVTSDIHLWVIGVPDVPYAYGGTKQMIAGINLKYIEPKNPLIINGRASKRLSYNATYHTNKLQFMWRHSVGYKLNLQAIMEFYKL